MASSENGRGKWPVVLVALGILVALAFGLARKPILISQHERKMIRAWEKATKTPATETGQGEFIAQYEASRDALVKLGYLEKREFRLKHVTVGSEARKRFWELICQKFADNIHAQLQAPGPGVDANSLATLYVWDRPENMAAWEDFVAANDPPSLPAETGHDAGGPTE